MKKIFFRFAFVFLAALGLISCETVADPSASGASASQTGSDVPDHKPRYDYWQNGGGACCPQHAHLF